MKLTDKEQRELDRLGDLWATRKATTRQIVRHMRLMAKWRAPEFPVRVVCPFERIDRAKESNWHPQTPLIRRQQFVGSHFAGPCVQPP